MVSHASERLLGFAMAAFAADRAGPTGREGLLEVSRTPALSRRSVLKSKASEEEPESRDGNGKGWMECGQTDALHGLSITITLRREIA